MVVTLNTPTTGRCSPGGRRGVNAGAGPEPPFQAGVLVSSFRSVKGFQNTFIHTWQHRQVLVAEHRPDSIKLLWADHKEAPDLFEDYEKPRDRSGKAISSSRW